MCHWITFRCIIIEILCLAIRLAHKQWKIWDCGNSLGIVFCGSFCNDNWKRKELKIMKCASEYSRTELCRCTEIPTTEPVHLLIKYCISKNIILCVFLLDFFCNNWINGGHFMYQSFLTGIMKQIWRLFLCTVRLCELRE